MSCGVCWPDQSINLQENGAFRLVRDPGHWGSANPIVLVLGVSKGNTQSNAFRREPFDAVAFKGIRHRLLSVLQSVGLLVEDDIGRFEQRFQADEKEYAFASAVRCSLTGMDPKKGSFSAESPKVVPAFKVGSAGHHFTSACVDRHIGQLPKATRLVVLLGNTDNYIKHISHLIGCSRGNLNKINEVAYEAGGVLFVHASHPSKGNGHFGAYIRGEGTPGEKMRRAREAVSSVQFG